MVQTPVVIIIFNRYDNAIQVFEKIKLAQPKELFVIADGPRKNKPGEKEKCEKARSIINMVDWPCNVHKIFADENMGCAKRVTSGLNEVFNTVERAIIFEDDCIPSESFFPYCDELLERYKDNDKIMLVSGNNKTFATADDNEKSIGNDSYFFSKQIMIWGWATWKRAWQKMDLQMQSWPEIRKSNLINSLYKKTSWRYYWKSSFDYVYKGHTNSWAFPWVLSVWKEDGLSIIPRVNLIRNAGFTEDATHTSGESIFESLDYSTLSFPLNVPKTIQRNEYMDNLEMKGRIIDSKQLPFPLNMIASKIKWTLLKLLGKDKSTKRVCTK
jgi:hypothetical protein